MEVCRDSSGAGEKLHDSSASDKWFHKHLIKEDQRNQDLYDSSYNTITTQIQLQQHVITMPIKDRSDLQLFLIFWTRSLWHTVGGTLHIDAMNRIWQKWNIACITLFSLVYNHPKIRIKMSMLP